MKKLEAVIIPSSLDDVKDAMIGLRVKRMTSIEVKAYGRELGHREIYRGSVYMDYSVPGIKVEVVVQDWHVEAATEILAKATVTGEIDDSNVLVIAVEPAAEHAPNWKTA